MAVAKFKKLRRDTGGAAIAEFSIVSGVMLMILFGLVEFANVYAQWNAATKAVQVGARIAAVGDPVWEDLADMTGFEASGNNTAGPAGGALGWDYSVTCAMGNNNKVDCSKNVGTDIPNSIKTDGSETAFENILYGLGNTACGGVTGSAPGMCDIFPRITEDNLQITYEHNALGYIGRPGGMVPTITLEIVGLTFQYIFLDDLMGIFGRANLNTVPIPGLKTTITAEDMRSSAPSF